MMMTGCGYIWTTDFFNDANFFNTAGFQNIVGGKGNFWQYGTGGVTQAIVGGGGLNGSNSGSRTVHTLIAFNQSLLGVGARGYCSHIEVG
jgi:hypothetical protein